MASAREARRSPSALKPRSSRNTASVCWPSVGGGVRTAPGVSDSLTGTPSTRSGPIVACSTLAIISRAASWGSANTSSRSRTDPHGTPAVGQPSIQDWRGVAAAAGRRERPQLVVVGDALAVGGEPLVVGQLRDRAEPAPLVVVADREHEIAVRRGERFVGHDASDGDCRVAAGPCRSRNRCRPDRSAARPPNRASRRRRAVRGRCARARAAPAVRPARRTCR